MAADAIPIGGNVTAAMGGCRSLCDGLDRGERTADMTYAGCSDLVSGPFPSRTSKAEREAIVMRTLAAIPLLVLGFGCQSACRLPPSGCEPACAPAPPPCEAPVAVKSGPVNVEFKGG